jgi:GT2 family glycosyltransferase
MIDSLPISVAIPTYGREDILIATIRNLMALKPSAAEILVVDQTVVHEATTQRRLEEWADAGSIRWLRMASPSITAAMNRGLLEAQQNLVLFVDDDVVPEPELLTSHVEAHEQHRDGLVAGRVIQPWQENVDFTADDSFHCASLRARYVQEFIGCNFSVDRRVALGIGGFDENFVQVAFRYEAEFAHRFLREGRRIWFEPAACLHHLKVRAGGTRSFGEHLTTWKPAHAVGAYYHALRTGAAADFVTRPLRSVATRHHLRHPWQVPGTLVAELRGMLWAMRLNLGGPKLVGADRIRKTQ